MYYIVAMFVTALPMYLLPSRLNAPQRMPSGSGGSAFDPRALKEPPKITHRIPVRFLLRVRLVEDSHLSIQLHRDPRSLALKNLSAESPDKSFYLRPSNVLRNGLCENGFERFPLFRVHPPNDTTFSIMRKAGPRT